MDTNGWDVVIGEIVATFGLRGEVKVLPQTDYPERFEQLKEVYVSPDKGRGRIMEIASVRFHKGVVLVRFAGIDDISTAETLRGMKVRVQEEEEKPLGKGEYYVHDIIGMDVVTTEGKDLGKVTEILRSPANDVYVTDRAMIPAVKEIVASIDLDQRKITVIPIEGLEQE